MVGRGSRAGATSSDGVTTDYADRDGIPAPLPVVCGVWGAHASGVARDDVAREFWASRAGDGGVFDGTDRGKSARSAGNLSDARSDGRERGQHWNGGTG